MNATPRPWDFEGMTIIEKATRKRLMVLSNALGSDGVMEHEGNCEILLNAVNSYDAMRELINQNDDLLAELSQYVSDEHIRLIAEQRKRNNDTLDRIEEGEINQ